MVVKRKLKTKKRVVQKKQVGLSDGFDVAADADLGKLDMLLKQHPVVVILIHADWCGHCQTYKPLWEKYKRIPGRTIPMASINQVMLAKTPLKDAKIDGFPSNVVYSGRDGSFGSFKNDKGEDTHSVPNARDEAAMTTLLRGNPSLLNGIAPDSAQSETAKATPEAEMLREESGKRAIRDKNIPLVNGEIPIPPNVGSNSLPRAKRTRKTRKKRVN